MEAPEKLAPSTRTTNWHALDRAQVEEVLQTSASGLSSSESNLRLGIHGPNELPSPPPASRLLVLLRQLRSPLIYILLAATGLTLFIGDYVDASVIAAAVLLNTIVGFVQERKADVSVQALMRLVSPRSRVMRDGREREVESRDVVPGDLVLLESGARVPADLRLVWTTTLSIDESLLTGESVPSAKSSQAIPAPTLLPDRTDMAYAGTVVVSGRGHGLVVATGARTQLGTIAEEIRAEPRFETPLQRRMEHFSRVIGMVVGAGAVTSFALGVARGEDVKEMLLLAVGVAVSAIPEGLPVVLTITLAVGVRRMARRHAILRRLPAVETLGSTTVIGSDKTGTLTENRMTVEEMWAGGEWYRMADFASSDAAHQLAENHPLYLALLTGVLANEADLYDVPEGFVSHGDPTEVALLVAAMRMGVEHERCREEYQTFAEIPFEPERQYSASIRLRKNRTFTFVKGAPERVASMCSSTLTARGTAAMNTGPVHEAVRRMAGRGLRVLALAYSEAPALDPGADRPGDPEGLCFLGLTGMIDPPRPGVRDAIRGCQAAGIRVLMITGDHAATARAIGSDLGLATANAGLLTGQEMNALEEDELRRRVADASIFARVSPEQKLRIVRALQGRGEVVAVTGDGINDAPALKAADIGVAMGQGGTDVAREASDMVLADDNFVSIYSAVEEGRIVFDNIRKVTFFLLSTGAAGLITILAALSLGWPVPLLPAQLLWLNVVTNGLQDVALAMEPGEAGVLSQPPRRRREGIISSLLWERLLIAGLVMAAGTLLLFKWELHLSGSLERAQTIALTTMVVFQILHVGNCRSTSRSIFQVSLRSNPFLLLAAAGALCVHIGALYLRPTQYILRVVPVLDVQAWIRMAVVSCTIVAAMELHKLLRRPARSAS